MHLQCESTIALGALHTELLQPPVKIGILESGCSMATEPTAAVSRYYKANSCEFTLMLLSTGRLVQYYATDHDANGEQIIIIVECLKPEASNFSTHSRIAFVFMYVCVCHVACIIVYRLEGLGLY